MESTIDDVGTRTSLVYPEVDHPADTNCRTLSLTYDELQRLTAITEGGDTIADYDYKGLYLQDRGKVGSGVGRGGQTDCCEPREFFHAFATKANISRKLFTRRVQGVEPFWVE